MPNLSFRTLTDAEVAALPAEAFPGRGAKPADAEMVGLVDEDTGRALATMMLQCVVHCEGMWLDPALRGDSEGLRAGIFQLLVRWMVENGFDGFVSQILGGKTEEWVKTLGAVQLPGTTYGFICR